MACSSTVDNRRTLLDNSASGGRFNGKAGFPPFPTYRSSDLIHMSVLILASGSETRATLLRHAGLEISVQPARIDEENLRLSLQADGATTADLADALAEHKASKVSQKNAEGLVLGCDQILDLDGKVMTKPDSRDHARTQLLH